MGKTESFPVGETLEISSGGTMLIFNTLADYEKVVNDPTDEMRLNFLDAVKKMEHVTYEENRVENSASVGEDLIDNDYFGQILNKDLERQIKKK